jgi:hypothetical protein
MPPNQKPLQDSLKHGVSVPAGAKAWLKLHETELQRLTNFVM